MVSPVERTLECPFCEYIVYEFRTSRGRRTTASFLDMEARLWLHCIMKHRDNIRVILNTPNELSWWIDNE